MMSFETLSLFDYFILIIIIISMIFSFMKGFVQSLLGLLTWIGSTIITLIFYENLSNFISSYINRIEFFEQSGLSVIISTVLSIPFIFLLSLILLRKIKSLISTNFQKSSLGTFFDKIFGIIYGFTFGLIIISITTITIEKIYKNFQNTKLINNSTLYTYLDIINKDYIIKYSPLIVNESNTVIENNSN